MGQTKDEKDLTAAKKELEEAKAAMEQAQKELAEVQAAKAAAEKELAEAENAKQTAIAEAEQLAAAKAAAEKAAVTDPSKDLVTIHLFKDNERYKDDVFVAVNGKRWQIKRGVDVQVPRYVADLLEQSRKQDVSTAYLIERESSAYEQQAKALDI